MESYKSGQGSLARLVAFAAATLALVMGALEVYSWMYDPATDVAIWPLNSLELFQMLPVLDVALSWKLLLTIALFFAAAWGLRRTLTRHKTVDALIETEAEMRKVAWPTIDEARGATLIVILVTLVMTASLAIFDTVLSKVFRLVF